MIKGTCTGKHCMTDCKNKHVYVGRIHTPEGSSTGFFITGPHKWPIILKNGTTMTVQTFKGDKNHAPTLMELKLEYLTD